MVYRKYQGHSEDWHRKVAEMVKANWTLDEIASQLKVHVDTIRLSVQKYMYLLREEVTPICFGYKNEAYLTEEEMLEGYQVPTYKELSIDEQIIYDYESEKKKKK